MEKRMNLLSLTWPIFIENVLFMLLGFIDIFVLSRYNDIAASAVSAANQVISICNLVFSIISGATAILISQSLGAQKRQTASMIAALSLVFSSIIGIVISALIALFHRPLLAALGAQGQILEYGCEYLLIVGGFIFTQAILNSVTAILRSHGYTKTSMYVTAIMNILNAVLDTAFVLGLFGLPSLGVRGVAIATTLARVAGICILCFLLFKGVESPSIFALLKPFPKQEAKKILLVGIPSAFETINYNVAQLVVTSIIGQRFYCENLFFQHRHLLLYLFQLDCTGSTDSGRLPHRQRGYRLCRSRLHAFAESFPADCYVHQHRSTVCTPVSDDGVHHRSGDRPDRRISVLYRSVCRAGTNLQYRSHQWPARSRRHRLSIGGRSIFNVACRHTRCVYPGSSDGARTSRHLDCFCR